jgi:tellurite resistance protein TerC
LLTLKKRWIWPRIQPDNPLGKQLLHTTPLLLAQVLIELVDLVFAVDSVPAAQMQRFIYLTYVLTLVLMFIGGKIFLHDIVEIPPCSR